ncbi:MAG: methyltransferase domain-containing protein [Gammaproteobacteria bacterium]|nr:methyltransferase domain-containing protein [Gammaproteobacteria bacterium]
MKLNLGCGSHVPDGWINVDYALGARFVKLPFFSLVNKKLKLFDMDWGKKIYLHDLTKKFPWDSSSIDVIYSSHTLEHFSREEGRTFLGECYRVLRKGGIIRIVVPDLMHNVIEYIEGRIRADDFLELLGVLYGDSSNEMKKKLAPFYKYPHKCMYDTPRLVTILNEIGFQASSRGAFDSDIEGIRMIELEGRTEHSVIAEGRKA